MGEDEIKDEWMKAHELRGVDLNVSHELSDEQSVDDSEPLPMERPTTWYELDTEQEDETEELGKEPCAQTEDVEEEYVKTILEMVEEEIQEESGSDEE